MITYGLCQRTTRYDKIQKNDLWLLSMFDSRHQNGYENVAWVIARWMKRKRAGTQKESQICYGQFISKIARKCRVLTEDVDLYDRMGRMEIRQEAIERMGLQPTWLCSAAIRPVLPAVPPPPPQYQQQQQDDDE
ncbi:hypothetical protein Tco_0190931 [Tanacetum coccineum]